jgi:hypothetical protein
MNIADIAFLAIVAGFLMSRFGLRFGLMANPAVVLALTAAPLVVAPVAGAASTPFFFLAVTTRLLDIVFTDGTTRTSVNAAFQAVAPGDRLVVQTGVEGVGVPAALGAVGVLLLILDAVGAGTTAVAVAMAVVVAGWVCAGWIVFRGYRRNIAVRIRRRQIEPIEIGLDDPVTRGVVESLVASGDVVKLRAGLDLLADAGDDRLSEVVDGLLHDADPVRRAEGLSRLVGDPRRLRIEMAETLLADDAAQVRAAAARVVCAGGRAELAEALLEDPSLEVRVSSATALRLSGGGEIVESHLAAWAGDPDASIRQAAASVLAETLDVGDSEILLELCADAEPSVRDAALRAAELHPRADVLDALLSQTFPRSAGPGLVAVLAAGGTSVRHLVTAGLAAADQAPWGVPRWRLVRAVARFDPDSAFEVLGPYVDDADPVVRATVRRTLLDVGWEGSPGHSRLAEALASDTSRLVATLAALDAVATVDSEGLLARALRDAIADQTSAIALLADLTTGTTVASHARRMLESDSEGRRAMALESIEVTFGREMRRLLGAALTPGLSVGERLVQLGGTRSDVEATVGAILSGEGSGVDPWIRACAVQRRRDRRGDRVGRRSVVFGELTAGIRSAEPRPRGPHGRRCRR